MIHGLVKGSRLGVVMGKWSVLWIETGGIVLNPVVQ